jgi:hypothetical protein
MTFEEFNQTLEQSAAPAMQSQALQALWWDARGDWDKAHELAQAQDDAAGAWVHAYLHRKEGDIGNAGYWYRRAGRPAQSTALKDEWEVIARALLA